ncbi:hypothetical protein A9Q84_11565 [Halobacteriovorax marinus]|uniref:Fatty acid hydroxylase domain-containing protein n=1 Tax=Halobacteriovorax marinus TaxID=97084 RepID=A0A1Y5F7Q7_9BACT|nr:hypothetical protein A9Q84_11565 [Halobacteriovorax marinus]
MIDFFSKLVDSVFIFNKPANRLYFLYLISSLIIVFLFSKEGRKIFSKKYWLHQSAVFDYKIFLFNQFLKILVIIPLMFSVFQVSSLMLSFLYQVFGNVKALVVSDQNLVWIFTITSFVLNDFARFFMHFLMHKIPVLWNFHRTHHTATVLTPFTLFRNHPVEVLLSQFRNLISYSLISTIFLFLFNKQVGGVDILGVNIFGFAFNFIGSNLRHSHIFLGYGPLEYFFISPAQHQIHHARASKFYDKNFGVAIALWDFIFGSLVISKKIEMTSFGVDELETHHTFNSQVIRPIKNLFLL